MSMRDLVDSLSKMHGVKFGCGPDHPTNPDRGLKKYLREHLEKYPFLKRHTDFIDFLKLCAGALVDTQLGEEESDYWFTTLYGIGPWEMVEACADAVDAEGFYDFAVSDIGASHAKEDSVAVFGLDATGNRGTEVYAAVRKVGGEQTPMKPYCSHFTEWLRRFVQAKGRLLPVEEQASTGDKQRNRKGT